VAGGVVERVEAALNAGCDMALVCNRPDLADEVLAKLKIDWPAPARARLARMHGHPHPSTMTHLRESARYVNALHHIGRAGTGFRRPQPADRPDGLLWPRLSTITRTTPTLTRATTAPCWSLCC